MSFWARVKTAITDVEVFKQMCDRHDVDYREGQHGTQQGLKVHALLQDRQGRSHAYLCKQAAGKAYQLVIDNDAGYSSLTARLGANGGKLMRDYSVAMVRKSITANGGFVTSEQEASDGSVYVKCGLAANF